MPIQVTGEFSMIRVTVPTNYIHEKYLGRPSCPKCGELLMAPEYSECLDHFVILGEAHLRRILGAYAAYYNVSRTHRS